MRCQDFFQGPFIAQQFAAVVDHLTITDVVPMVGDEVSSVCHHDVLFIFQFTVGMAVSAARVVVSIAAAWTLDDSFSCLS